MDVLTLDELKIINEKINKEIENLENPTTTSSNQYIGRPRKKTILYKKAELRIDKKIYDKLIILAELDGRSTNNYICQILNNHVNDFNNNQLIKKYEQYKSTK